MSEKIKIAMYGCGKMGSICMKYAKNKGGNLVLAFDKNPAVVGTDIGDLMGTGAENVRVYHVDEAEKWLKEVKPDICMIATQTLMKDVKDIMKICARNGVNAVTISEEAFFPWNSSPKTTAEIDALAKENNCTICGSGYQDVCYGSIVTTAAGVVHNIDKIEGLVSYNLEDYGIGVAEFAGAHLSMEDFLTTITASDEISDEERAALIENETYYPSFMWNVNGWIASQMGLTITRQFQKKLPTTHSEDLVSKTLNKTIEKGQPTGMTAIVTSETKEGILIESQITGKVYGPEDKDTCLWRINGEEDTEIEFNKSHNVSITCAGITNRIPDVINADSGYVTTDSMPTLVYRTKEYHHYIKK